MNETTPEHTAARTAAPRRDTGATADFAGLMHLYGCNYQLLKRLCRGFNPEPGSGRVTARDGYLLALSVECRTRYTTTLHLVCSFSSSIKTAPPTPILHFRIRAYHDTRQAEVIRPDPAIAADTRRRPEFRHSESLCLKWRFNYFLGNALSYFS